MRLGHRLAQMSLGFGADELFGPIMPERALRLGANANNPVMTRKEAATLIRGAGLRPCERIVGRRTGGGASHEPSIDRHSRQGAAGRAAEHWRTAWPCTSTPT